MSVPTPDLETIARRLREAIAEILQYEMEFDQQEIAETIAEIEAGEWDSTPLFHLNEDWSKK